MSHSEIIDQQHHPQLIVATVWPPPSPGRSAELTGTRHGGSQRSDYSTSCEVINKLAPVAVSTKIA